MNDNIEQKALALVNKVGVYYYPSLGSASMSDLRKALLRAIEQHEAFRCEVSDAVEAWRDADVMSKVSAAAAKLHSFILPKPVDPFVALVGEAFWNDPNEPDAVHCAACILAGLKARGLEIREVKP